MYRLSIAWPDALESPGRRAFPGTCQSWIFVIRRTVRVLPRRRDIKCVPLTLDASFHTSLPDLMAPRTRSKRADYQEIQMESDDDNHARECTCGVRGRINEYCAHVVGTKPRTKRPRKAKDGDTSYATGNEPKTKLGTASSRRAGKLRNLMLMPVDIFAEVLPAWKLHSLSLNWFPQICTYLHPKDLRSLSLTTKGLRSILMSKNSKHIWKSCLNAIAGIPECPRDMREPEYVRLLFTAMCYVRLCGPHTMSSS